MSAKIIMLSEMNIAKQVGPFTTGYVVYKQDVHLGPRTQNDLQLVFVYEGEMEIWIDSVSHYLGEGETALLHPGHTEYFQFNRKGRTRHGWCTWVKPEFDNATRTELDSLPFSTTLTSRTRRLARMTRSLRSDRSGGEAGLRDALCMALFWDYFRQTGFRLDASPPPPEPVRRAILYMQTHLAEAVTLSDLAEAASITPAHLIRIFRQHMQVTPIRYLWQLRVEAGLHLLRDTGLQAGEIAYKTGFQTPHHFSRLVHQHTGYSPLTYRRQLWNKR